jgi:hypothetical protein
MIPRTIITAKKFKELTKENPSWATEIKEDLGVNGPVRLFRKPITHLSPHLHFLGDKKGEDENSVALYLQECNFIEKIECVTYGRIITENCWGIKEVKGVTFNVDSNTEKIKSWGVANFWECPKIENIEGEFPGFVSFKKCSGLETAKVNVTHALKGGEGANFHMCTNLKKVEGIINGHVNFGYSGIEDTENLIVTEVNMSGESANFEYCTMLKKAMGRFKGAVKLTGSAIEKIDLTIENCDNEGKKLRLLNCRNLKELPLSLKEKGIKTNEIEAEKEKINNYAKRLAISKFQKERTTEIEF